MAIQTGTLKAYPQAVDDTYSNYPELTNPTTPVGKGSSNGDYAYWYSGYQNSKWTYWPFDLSEIPENAIIDSVTCLAKAGYYSASDVNIATLQLYCGNTAKGTATSFVGKTGQILSIDGGSWTREELKTCGLQVLGNSVGSNATYRRFYFYGADLTIEYTFNNDKFMLKIDNFWVNASRVFKKINDIWIEQTDLANVIEDGIEYKNNGEIISPKPTFTIQGVVYQFEDGMTWAQWVVSSYNTGGFETGYVDWLGEDGVVTADGDHAIMDNTETLVLATYLIVENHAYTITEV